MQQLQKKSSGLKNAFKSNDEPVVDLSLLFVTGKEHVEFGDF